MTADLNTHRMSESSRDVTPDASPELSPELTEALSAFATAPRVLVAFDFDGTLAPLVDDPDSARAVDGSIPALHALATDPSVAVALVSGRDLDTLRRLTGAEPAVVLIGSHGAQWSTEHGSAELTDRHRSAYTALRTDLDRILTAHPNARLETKPAALVLHTRGLDASEARAAHAEVEAMLRRHPEVHTTPGKDVLEMSVLDVGKGPAILELARRHGTDAVLFAGDDVTDERAFAVLSDSLGDAALTVKVGEGDTAARFRIADERAALGMIAALTAGRR